MGNFETSDNFYYVQPSIKKYLDEKRFSNFDLTDGNLNWNDYEMIFSIWDLYGLSFHYFCPKFHNLKNFKTLLRGKNFDLFF